MPQRQLCLVNRRGPERKTRRRAELVDTISFQVKKVRHEEGRYEREPRRLDDETTTRTKDRAVGATSGARRVTWKFFAGVFEQSSGSEFDMCRESSVSLC